MEMPILKQVYCASNLPEKERIRSTIIVANRKLYKKQIPKVYTNVGET